MRGHRSSAVGAGALRWLAVAPPTTLAPPTPLVPDDHERREPPGFSSWQHANDKWLDLIATAGTSKPVSDRWSGTGRDCRGTAATP